MCFQNHDADLEIYIYPAGIRILISSGSVCFLSLLLLLLSEHLVLTLHSHSSDTTLSSPS